MCSDPQATPAAPTTRRVYVATNGKFEACGFTDVAPGTYEPCDCYLDRSVEADVPEPLPGAIAWAWVAGFAPAVTHRCPACPAPPRAAEGGAS